MSDTKEAAKQSVAGGHVHTLYQKLFMDIEGQPEVTATDFKPK